MKRTLFITVTLLFLLPFCGTKKYVKKKITTTLAKSKDNLAKEQPKYLAEPRVKYLFKHFKQRYNKRYSPEEERGKFDSFVDNYKKITELNNNFAKNTPGNIQYRLNQYSDLTSAEAQDHYAVRLPYDKIETSKDLRDGDPKSQSIDEPPLYDLYNAGKLYEDFKKKMNFTYSEDDKDEDLLHYYRFIKTLVEINRNNAQREGPVRTIDYDADVLKEPNETFWIL